MIIVDLFNPGHSMISFYTLLPPSKLRWVEMELDTCDAKPIWQSFAVLLLDEVAFKGRYFHQALQKHNECRALIFL